MKQITQILSESENIVLDTSVLMCYFMDEFPDINSILDDYIFNLDSKTVIYGHNLIKTELFYIICRLKGLGDAENLIKQIDSILNMISDIWLYKKAACIKCKYPIAISDCFSISLGIHQDCPVFFLPEKELSVELIENIKEEFNAEIYRIEV